MHIKVGTRGSKLALAQADRVVRQLADYDIKAERVILTTKGDTVTGVPLHEIGGQGVSLQRSYARTRDSHDPSPHNRRER